MLVALGSMPLLQTDQCATCTQHFRHDGKLSFSVILDIVHQIYESNTHSDESPSHFFETKKNRRAIHLH